MRTGRAEELLAEASWLEGLARALVGDREEARDLVQEVWLRTLEERPEGVRRPRAWLAQVLRNTLGMRRRASGARSARERATARPEATAGSAEVVARAESLRLLVEAVLALEEPLRSTVLWHHFDGLSSAAIARRQGVPASTVRNRLAQALAELRARLGNSRSDWRASLGLIVCAEAARGAPLAPGVAVVATLALCGLGTAWWALGRSSSQESAPAAIVAHAPTRPVAEPLPAALRSAREPLAPSAGVPSSEDSRAKPAPLPPGVLEVEVLDDGRACTHAGYFELARSWYPWMEDEEPEALQRVEALRPGAARVEGLAPGNYGVRFVSAAHTALSAAEQLTAEAGARVVLLGGTGSFHGTVWDDSGLPMAGVEVVLSLPVPPEVLPAGALLAQETGIRARTAADGRYSLAGLGAGEYALFLGSPGEDDLHQLHFSRRLEAGSDQQLDFGRPGALPVWSGTLVSRSGLPHLGAATVRLFRGRDFSLLRKTGPDGRFALGLEPGTYEVEIELDPQDRHDVPLGSVVLTESGLQQDLVLPGTRLDGQVRFESGAPLPAGHGLVLAVDPLGREKPFARQYALVEADGHFVLEALAPGVYEFVVHPHHLAAPELRIEILADDVSRSLDVILRNP